MAVGSAAVAVASRACSEAGTRRFRRASAAPDTKGKKLGGGARASPPHKTLSGFAIRTHYTRSEPAVDQLGGEFHGRLCGGVGTCDGEHGPHVVCQGAEARRCLVGKRGPPAMRLWRSRSVVICWSRGFLMREEYYRFENPASLNALTRSSTTRPIMSPSASLQPFLLGNRFAWLGSSTNVSRPLPSRPRMCFSRL